MIYPFAVEIQFDSEPRVLCFPSLFYPPEHSRSLKGGLADKIKETPENCDWREIQEEAWRAAAEEKGEA